MLLALVAWPAFGCSLFGGAEEVTDAGDRADAAMQVDEQRSAEVPGTPAGVERHGDLWLVRVEAPVDEKLDARAREVALLHSRAAQAADGILFRQIGDGLPLVRRMLAGVLSAGDRVPQGIREKLEAYAARFFANHGTLDARTGRKFIPRIIPGQLAAAAQIALESGADIGLEDLPGRDLGASPLQELEALMLHVRPRVFDRGYAPAREQADGGAPPDADPPAAAELKQVIAALRGALEHQQGAERARAERVIAALESGDEEAAARVPLSSGGTGGVRTVIGGVPSDGDPRGVKSAFAALVMIEDSATAGTLAALRQQAPALDRAVAEAIGVPKTAGRVEPARVLAVEAVAATGWYGPILPNARRAVGEPTLRAPGWDGPILLTNVAAAADRVLGERAARAFGADDAVAARQARWRSAARLAFLALRETAGRGTDGTEKRPREFLDNRLGASRRAIDEARADLTALYLAFSEEVRALGLVPEQDCARAMYDWYVSRALTQLVLVDPGAQLERPETQAVQIVVRNLIARGVVAQQREGERVRLLVPDHAKMRDAIGQLLAEVRGIRNGGQTARAAELVEGLGRTPPPGWAESARSAWAEAGLPWTMGFVYPRLEERGQGAAAPAGVQAEASETFVDAQISAITRGFE